MIFEDWLKIAFPNKGNNDHTTYSKKEMKMSYFAGSMHGDEEKTMEEEVTTTEVQEEKKTGKAKHTSLIAQIIAALWVAVWCGKKFVTETCEVSDIIFSGFAIAACFCPVYFNMILDKIKKIKFGE